DVLPAGHPDSGPGRADHRPHFRLHRICKEQRLLDDRSGGRDDRTAQRTERSLRQRWNFGFLNSRPPTSSFRSGSTASCTAAEASSSASTSLTPRNLAAFSPWTAT